MKIIPLEKNAKAIYEKNVLLKIVESPRSKDLIRNKYSKKLLSLPNLCTYEIRNLVDTLVKMDAVLTFPSIINNLLQISKGFDKIKEFEDPFKSLYEGLKKTKIVKRLENTMEKSLTNNLKDEFEKMTVKEKERFTFNFFSNFGFILTKEQLIKKSIQMEEINKELETMSGQGLLTSTEVNLCPKCDIVFDENVFDTCIMCGKTPTKETLRSISIGRVPKQIAEMWSSNLWFEAFFAGVLSDIGWKKNWTNIHVLGSSGMMHEIDVLSIKKGRVFVCECKTGRTSRKDIFNFWAKLSDIKAHYGILALLGNLPDPETREFVQKNPSIICLEYMGTMKDQFIIDELWPAMPIF